MERVAERSQRGGTEGLQDMTCVMTCSKSAGQIRRMRGCTCELELAKARAESDCKFGVAGCMGALNVARGRDRCERERANIMMGQTLQSGCSEEQWVVILMTRRHNLQNRTFRFRFLPDTRPPQRLMRNQTFNLVVVLLLGGFIHSAPFFIYHRTAFMLSY